MILCTAVSVRIVRANRQNRQAYIIQFLFQAKPEDRSMLFYARTLIFVSPLWGRLEAPEVRSKDCTAYFKEGPKSYVSECI